MFCSRSSWLNKAKSGSRSLLLIFSSLTCVFLLNFFFFFCFAPFIELLIVLNWSTRSCYSPASCMLLSGGAWMSLRWRSAAWFQLQFSFVASEQRRSLLRSPADSFNMFSNKSKFDVNKLCVFQYFEDLSVEIFFFFFAWSLCVFSLYPSFWRSESLWLRCFKKNRFEACTFPNEFAKK